MSPEDPTAAAIAGLLERWERDGQPAAIVAALREQVPGYGRLPAAVLDGAVLADAHAGVAALERALSAWEIPGDGELASVRDSARARAEEGVPLDDVLRAHRLTVWTAWEALAAEAISGDEREALIAAAGLIMRFTDRVCSAASETYLDARQYRLAEDARLVAQLIDVLASENPVPEGLRAVATRIGCPILEIYRPFALARPGSTAAVHSQTAASLRLQRVLAISEGEAIIGLADPETAPAALGGGRALVALGDPARRGELRLALDDVRLLLAVARRRGQEQGIVDAVEFAAPLLVAASPRLANQLRRRVLGPLEAYEGGTSGAILQSLRTYFAAQLNRGRAAAELGVHPNTLDYRLGRIEELCQVRLSDPRDIARIELALAQLELDGGA